MSDIVSQSTDRHLLQRIFYTTHKCDGLIFALFKASSYLSATNCTRRRRRMAGYL